MNPSNSGTNRRMSGSGGRNNDEAGGTGRRRRRDEEGSSRNTPRDDSGLQEIIRSNQFPGWSIMAEIAGGSPPTQSSSSTGNERSDTFSTLIGSRGITSTSAASRARMSRILANNISEEDDEEEENSSDDVDDERRARLSRILANNMVEEDDDVDDDEDEDIEIGVEEPGADIYDYEDTGFSLDVGDEHDDFMENILRDNEISMVLEPSTSRSTNTQQQEQHRQQKQKESTSTNNLLDKIPSYLEATAYGPLKRHQEALRQMQSNKTDADLSITQDQESPHRMNSLFDIAPDLDPMGPAQRLSISQSAQQTADIPLFRDGSFYDQAFTSSSSGQRPPSSNNPHQQRFTQGLLSMWMAQSKKKQAELALPTAWNPKDKSTNLDLDKDGLVVTYAGTGKGDSDSGMVRANKPMMPQCGVYYYEVEIVSRGQSGYIGIGFGRYQVNLERLPGWDKNSWGYHGDDGKVFASEASGTTYGPRFSTGDVIGCGINFMNRTGFYTRNGVYLGTAFRNLDTAGPLFPAVGMRTPAEKVNTNFGANPFKFDIDLYVQEQMVVARYRVREAPVEPLLMTANEETNKPSAGQPMRKKQQKSSRYKPIVLGKIPTSVKTPGSNNTDLKGSSEVGPNQNILEVILCYLMHHGYYETARELIINLLGSSSSEGKLSDDKQQQLQGFLDELHDQDKQMRVRRAICEHVHKGEIDAALKLTREHYPRTLEENELLLFRLQRWRFIELVRESSGKAVLEEVDDDDEGGYTSSDDSDVMMNGGSANNGAQIIADADAMSIEEQPSSRAAQSMSLVTTILKEGRKLQSQYSHSKDPRIKKGLDTAFSLMAYSNPLDSPVAMLLDPIAREVLANSLNTAILASESRPQSPTLETMYRQAACILSQLVQEGDGAAALLRIERDCLPPASAGKANATAGGEGGQPN